MNLTTIFAMRYALHKMGYFFVNDGFFIFGTDIPLSNIIICIFECGIMSLLLLIRCEGKSAWKVIFEKKNKRMFLEE